MMTLKNVQVTNVSTSRVNTNCGKEVSEISSMDLYLRLFPVMSV